MSFSLAQRTDTYLYLGYPLVPTNTVLDAAIDAAEGSGTRREEIIIQILESLSEAEAKVGSLLGSAGIKSLDKEDLVFQNNPSQGGGFSAAQVDARGYGRLLVKRLAAALGVCILSDYFQAVDRSVKASLKPSRVQL